jgi:hypothetical protein
MFAFHSGQSKTRNERLGNCSKLDFFVHLIGGFISGLQES